MSKLIIQVNGGVYGTTASYRAYRYTEAALKAGHKVTRVFFYQDGVNNTSSLISPASDEFNLVNAWAKLAIQYQVELVNCVSAALRRGVLSEQESNELGFSQWNLHPNFIMGGLGELVTGIETSDRLVSF